MDPEDQNGIGPGQDAPALAPSGGGTPTAAVTSGGTPTGSGTNSSGIDWTTFQPSNEGLTKLDIWKTIANILLYVGYGAAFLAFLAGLIMWAIGHKIGGRHVLEEAKTTILRSIIIGVILGSAGLFWNWLMTK